MAVAMAVAVAVRIVLVSFGVFLHRPLFLHGRGNVVLNGCGKQIGVGTEAIQGRLVARRKECGTAQSFHMVRGQFSAVLKTTLKFRGQPLAVFQKGTDAGVEMASFRLVVLVGSQCRHVWQAKTTKTQPPLT